LIREAFAAGIVLESSATTVIDAQASENVITSLGLEDGLAVKPGFAASDAAVLFD
jgi:hypothetical protein